MSDLVLVFLKNIFQTRETVFHYIFLHLEFSIKRKRKQTNAGWKFSSLFPPFSEFEKPVKQSLSDISQQICPEDTEASTASRLIDSNDAHFNLRRTGISIKSVSHASWKVRCCKEWFLSSRLWKKKEDKKKQQNKEDKKAFFCLVCHETS